MNAIFDPCQSRIELLLPFFHQVFEKAKSVKVSLGCYVNSSLLLFIESHRELLDAVVNLREHRSYGAPELLITFDHCIMLKELDRNGSQSLLWPIIEPVQSTAAHERWEVPASDPEQIADRRHAHDDVEMQSQLLDVSLVDVVLTQGDSLLLHALEQ